MDFSKLIDIDDICAIISAISIIIGAVFALIKWSRRLKNENIKLISQLINTLLNDKDIYESFYLFEYDVNWYDSEFHNSQLERGDNLEYKVDKTLTFLNTLCFMLDEGVIKEKHFLQFQYYIHRALMSKSVINYLYNIYNFSKKLDLRCSYHYLINYAKDRFYKNSKGQTVYFINWAEFVKTDLSIYNKYTNI